MAIRLGWEHVRAEPRGFRGGKRGGLILNCLLRSRCLYPREFSRKYVYLIEIKRGNNTAKEDGRIKGG